MATERFVSPVLVTFISRLPCCGCRALAPSLTIQVYDHEHERDDCRVPLCAGCIERLRTGASFPIDDPLRFPMQCIDTVRSRFWELASEIEWRQVTRDRSKQGMPALWPAGTAT